MRCVSCSYQVEATWLSSGVHENVCDSLHRKFEVALSVLISLDQNRQDLGSGSPMVTNQSLPRNDLRDLRETRLYHHDREAQQHPTTYSTSSLSPIPTRCRVRPERQAALEHPGHQPTSPCPCPTSRPAERTSEVLDPA